MLRTKLTSIVISAALVWLGWKEDICLGRELEEEEKEEEEERGNACVCVCGWMYVSV